MNGLMKMAARIAFMDILKMENACIPEKMMFEEITLPFFIY